MRINYKHSEETKRKIGLANAIALKGRKLPKETCEKIRLNNAKYWKGKTRPEDTKKKISIAHKGKKPYAMTDEIRKKMSMSRKGKHYIKMSISKSSSKNPQWKGGVNKINQSIRNNIMDSLNYKLWHKSVFERDNYTCRMCFQKGKELNAHHIYSFNKFPELRFAINNGITLCKKCHKELHRRK